MSSPINGSNFSMADAIIRQTERIGTGGGVARPPEDQRASGSSFQEILDRQMQQKTLSFSKHASLRTIERNIRMTQADMARLGEACEKATSKGIKDALVISENAAFIVNAPNKIVVTVVDRNEMQNNVFTNIDGALFI